MTSIAKNQNPSQSPSKPNFICFNPHCKQPGNRLLSNITDHLSNDTCAKWIISTTSTKLKQFQHQSAKLFQLPFNDQPMQCILNYPKLKTLSLDKLRSYMDSLTKKISDSLKNIWQIFNIKLNTYFQPYQQLYQPLKQLFNKSTPSNINTFISSPPIKFILQSQNIFIHSSIIIIQNQIKSIIQSITQNIFSTKQNLISDIGISLQNKINLQKYLKDPTDDHNKKLSKLSNILKTDHKYLYQKRIQNSCSHPSSTQYLIKCPICLHLFSTQKKKQLLLVWTTFTNHLLYTHSEQLGYYYLHLINMKGNYHTTIHQIIYKLTNYQYQSLQFICKSGKQYYTFHYINRKKFSVQILTKGQSAQFPIKYLYVNQFQDFFCLLCYLLSTLCNNKKTKNKPIEIYTSNPMDINSIRKLNDLFNIKTLTVILQKKQTNNTIFQQDQGNVQSKSLSTFQDFNSSALIEEEHKTYC